jgi:thymidylate kinase
LDKEWLQAINAGLPEPTVTIFLDVPPQCSFQRRPERTDVLESDPAFLQAIYGLYKENLPAGAFIIDGTRPTDWVTMEILDKLALVNDSLTYSF